MAKKSSFKLVKAEIEVKKYLKKIYALALDDLRQWINTKLFPALIAGGYGIQGIAKTDFIAWALSNRGLSELGIYPKDVKTLLQALISSFKVMKTKNGLDITFGNFAKLRTQTPHPFAGEGLLSVTSWLELVKKPNPNYGFVPRSSLNKVAQEYIRLGKPKGGLMLEKGVFGSTGKWSAPVQYKNWEEQWALASAPKVQKLIMTKLKAFMEKRSR